MRKILLLLLVCVLTISKANAWSHYGDEAVVIVASEHLTPKAKKVVKRYLGRDFSDDVRYLFGQERAKAKQLSKKARRAAAEIHFLHLDSNFQPKSVKGKDAFKATEEALAVIKNHKSHSKEEVTIALRTVIELMCDMHNLARIRIDGIPHSQRDFKYQFPTAEYGKNKDVFKSALWSKTWLGFDGGNRHFSANSWAMDMRIYIGDRYAEYSKGTLRDWVADNGAIAAHYLEIYKPNAVVPYADHRWGRPVNYDMFIKSSCRLAALLNETLK